MFTDINRSKDTLNLDSKRLINRAGNRLNRSFVKGLITKVNPKDFNTFITKQGISLHSLCLLTNMNEEFENLVKTIGLEDHGMLFNEELHPVEIAIDTVNFKAMEVIAKHLEKKSSLLVTENLFSKALDSSSVGFKKAIVEAFLNPPGLDKDNLPNALAISSSEFPYIYKSLSKNLELEEIEKITNEKENSSAEM